MPACSRRSALLGAALLPVAGLCLGTATPAIAKYKHKPKAKSACTSRAGKAAAKKQGGKILQTLRSGQYYAYRQPQGNWTFCDGRRPVKRAFQTTTVSLGGQANNVGVALYSQRGRCVALTLRPQGTGFPIIAAVDMNPKDKPSGATLFPIDQGAPGARVVKSQLSSSCLLAAAYVSADGSRHIQLNGLTGSYTDQVQIDLSPSATDTDLGALSVSGNDVSWTDAGVKNTRHYGP